MSRASRCSPPPSRRPTGTSVRTTFEAAIVGSVSQRIEQRPLLRAEPLPADATVVVRGGRDTADKLASHALRTARAWSLDGDPLLGISVFAVVDRPLDVLLRERFATFRTVYLPTVAILFDAGFELLPTGRRPHFTVRLRRVDEPEVARLLVAFGPASDNPAYGQTSIWPKEG